MLTRRNLLSATPLAVPLTSALFNQSAGAATSIAQPLGLELFSLRAMLEKDVPRTLKKVRALGFRDVEVPGFYGLSASDFAAALRKAGLRSPSFITGYERLRDDMPGVITDMRALGATWVVCPWIPHEKRFTRDDCVRACKDFARFATTLRGAGASFAYHIHGFEFVPEGTGTLMDRLIEDTPADLVQFELDVFWVVRGGGDPVALIKKHGARMPLVHLKDIAKGMNICAPDGSAPDESSAILGQGMIDFPTFLRAAAATGSVKWYFIEDENPDALKQIPASVRYLRGIRG